MGNLVLGGQQHQIHSDLDVNALLYEDRASGPVPTAEFEFAFSRFEPGKAPQPPIQSLGLREALALLNRGRVALVREAVISLRLRIPHEGRSQDRPHQ
jgi:hypothetical protein